ncbi:MAG: helix-hairpin-helix domain-containing protein [Candidatus Hodarchaeales archaeon]|jgi:translation elongation factor P/translation initiation factor 5A
MEYKTANELKPKEYIIDPETEEVFQIITIKPGNKPRLMYREINSKKVTELIVSSQKQFLLAEIEELSYQLNYHSENNLYVMDYNTNEELVFDGTTLGKDLERLKSGFDSGKAIELFFERLGNTVTLKSFKTIEEKIPEQDIITEPKKRIDKPSKPEKEKPKDIKKGKPKKILKTEKPIPKSDTKPTSAISKDKNLNFKEFKGLGEKTFKLLTTEYGIKTLGDLIDADVDNLKKMPKVNEKKILDWKKQAKILLDK